MNNFKNRIIRAIKLDASLYKEVKLDKLALKQAMAVVVFSSVAGSICMHSLGIVSIAGLGAILLGVFGTLLLWYIRSYLILLIGRYLILEPQTKSDIGGLLRTLGFAAAPGIIMIFGVIAPLAQVVFLISGLWMIAAMVVAVRVAFGYNKLWRAISVCLVILIMQAVSAKFLLSRTRENGEIDLPAAVEPLFSPR